MATSSQCIQSFKTSTSVGWGKQVAFILPFLILYNGKMVFSSSLLNYQFCISWCCTTWQLSHTGPVIHATHLSNLVLVIKGDCIKTCANSGEIHSELSCALLKIYDQLTTKRRRFTLFSKKRNWNQNEFKWFIRYKKTCEKFLHEEAFLHVLKCYPDCIVTESKGYQLSVSFTCLINTHIPHTQPEWLDLLHLTAVMSYS